jgi:hypothetical protein
MDFLTAFFRKFEVHVLWALAVVLVAALVKYWPSIKARAAAGWTSFKTAFAKDEKGVKAVAELALQDVETAMADAAAEILALKTRIATIEKAFKSEIEAQVAKDAAELATATTAPVQA